MTSSYSVLRRVFGIAMLLCSVFFLVSSLRHTSAVQAPGTVGEGIQYVLSTRFSELFATIFALAWIAGSFIYSWFLIAGKHVYRAYGPLLVMLYFFAMCLFWASFNIVLPHGTTVMSVLLGIPHRFLELDPYQRSHYLALASMLLTPLIVSLLPPYGGRMADPTPGLGRARA